MIRVSFQGERGAYSEAAARSFFGGEIEAVPTQTFAEALERASSGDTGYAVLPVENSLEGSVGESYDLLYLTDLSAVGETYHRIEHCLIGTGRLGGIGTVYSHPQALGQCRGFIERNGMKTVPAYDTAGSVKMIKSIGREDVACIASREASGIYGVPVVASDIANNPNNYTRFLVLSGGASPETGSDKTSVIFSIKHEPGSLFRVIGRFHASGVNLTKIESRPAGTDAWEYIFYVDFEGHADSPGIAEMLRGLEADTVSLKVLGSYPSARRG